MEATCLNCSDECQIRSVLTRERYYRDTCQWESMRKTYHPENKRTRVNISWYDGEIDGFIKGSKAVTHGKVTTIHNLFCNEIQIRGSRAISESLCNITSRFEHGGFEYDKITTCRLLSRLERLGDCKGNENPWRILTLEPIYIRDSFVPATPIPPNHAPIFEGLDKYPKSYRHGAWLLASIGISSRSDLPNEDDYESVRIIIDRNKGWVDCTDLV